VLAAPRTLQHHVRAKELSCILLIVNCPAARAVLSIMDWLCTLNMGSGTVRIAGSSAAIAQGAQRVSTDPCFHMQVILNCCGIQCSLTHAWCLPERLRKPAMWCVCL
jgi:hypothetical protein